MKPPRSVGGNGQKAGASGPTRKINPAKGGNKTTRTSAPQCAPESKGAK